MKRVSVDVIFFNGIVDIVKLLEIFSIKIELISWFMLLDCVCEDFIEFFVIEDYVINIGFIFVRQIVVCGYFRVICLEFDFCSFLVWNYVNLSCLEDRMDFYRMFFLLIKLGLLVYKQQESQK